MNYEYNAVGYNTLYNEVILMINKLESINIDVSKYNNLVNEIDINLKDDINDRLIFKNNNLNDNNNYVFDFGIEGIYEPYIKKLYNIKSALLNYRACFVINSLCNYISYNNDDLDNINMLVDNSINCLKYVKNIKVLDYSVLSNMLDKLYNTIYMVIKKELLLNDSSILLDYVLSDNIYIYGLDSIIKESISNSELGNNDKVKLKCMELDSNRLDSNYVDIELLKLIVFIENKDIIIDKNIKDIRDTYDKLLDSNNELNDKKKDLDEDNVLTSKENFKGARDSLLKKGIPLGLVGSLVLYGGLGWLPNAKFLKENKYIYSSKKTTYIDGKLDSVEENDIGSEIILDDRVITIYDYEPWYRGIDGKYHREYTEYKYDSLSNEVIDINNLFSMDLSIYDDIVRTNTEDSYDFVIDCNKKVVIEENNKMNKELVFYALEMSYFGIIFCITYIWDYFYTKKYNYHLFEFLLFLIIDFVVNGIEYSKDKKRYKEKLNKIINEIKSNELLRSKFNALYHEFVSKYGEIDELKDMYDKVNNIKYDDILVKKKVKI